MSSTLDDMEPYEIFQIELDEFLKKYKSHLSEIFPNQPIEKKLLILNRFIEFICFSKSISSLKEISITMEKDFFSHCQTELNEITNEKEVAEIIFNYLNFIKR